MADSDGGDKPVLDRFAPDVIEEHIGHVELADLNGAHGDDAHEDEGLHLRLHARELGEEAYGENPTTGQKRISKRVKTFLLAMVQFL